MACLRIILIATLFLAHRGHSIAFNFGDITEMLNFARETTTGIFETFEWAKRREGSDDGENHFPYIKMSERRLIDRISGVSKKIDRLEDRIQLSTDEIISTITRDVPERVRFDAKVDVMLRTLDRIDNMYKKDFLNYLYNDKYEKFTMTTFAHACVSPKTGDLPDLLEVIHGLVAPTKEPARRENGIFVLLAQTSKQAAMQICSEEQSAQQLLYNLYNTIALTEIKGYAMMQFAYSYLKLNNNGTFNEEMNNARNEYISRTSATLRAVKIAMAFASRELWRCDPSVHKKDSTYTEMTQLFQGYIVNEVDLNQKSSCFQNCDAFQLTQVQGCYDNQYCAQQRRCNGKILNCQYIDSDMWICPSKKSSERRYEYIEYENGRTLGKKKSCDAGTTKVDSWWRYLFWHCSYCMCYCDDHNSSSDRYFSLREVTSDVDKNRVVTGIRLIKLNQIMHLQIEQGTLLPNGSIEESSVNWKKVEEFTVLDRNVENKIDYHTLSWEEKAIDLDDIVAPEYHVLTGVRFRLLGSHLNFEIRATGFNFATGELARPSDSSSAGHWLSNDSTDVRNPSSSENARTEFKLNKPDIPTLSRSSALPDSRPNQYLNFQASDLDKDAAQTTVPFLDIQPVSTNPPFPLSGAGVFHKGRDGSGGYIALKVITYDLTKHLNTDLPPESPLRGPNEIPSV